MDKYKVINGTSYHQETPDQVCSILQRAMDNGERIRVFYGDVETGSVWLEERDIIGYVGRSAGIISVPLLIKTTRSLGGGALLDNCIVRITKGLTDVYRHPNYIEPRLDIEPSFNPVTGNRWHVSNNGELVATFESELKAKNYRNFMEGRRNRPY